jgi:hypothetical protein
MYLCYIDESGVPEQAGTPHFVLVGLAIPSEKWKSMESQIDSVKQKYLAPDDEVHTAWIARTYAEQVRIPNFANLPAADRRRLAQAERDQHLLRLAATGSKKQLAEAKKNYKKTSAYIHLTHAERVQLLNELADCIGGWSDVRLFGQAIDKPFLATLPPRPLPPFEYAFTEVVQRFEYFLKNRGNATGIDLQGLLVQDNNETVAMRITRMMREFHRHGTRWTQINQIVETPFFLHFRQRCIINASMSKNCS